MGQALREGARQISGAEHQMYLRSGTTQKNQCDTGTPRQNNCGGGIDTDSATVRGKAKSAKA